MRLGRLEISGGALIVLAVLFYFDKNGILPWLLLACFLHELGHWIAIYALGGKIKGMRLSCGGAEICLSSASPLAPWKLTLVALAGPAVNLLLALLSYCLARRGFGIGLYLFFGINVGLACFNLLPSERLDGGRALNGFFCWVGRENLAEKAVKTGSKMVVMLLFLTGGILFFQSQGQNFSVLLAGAWLLGTGELVEKN